MKPKYLKITGDDLFIAKTSIDKQDLIDVLQGRVDHLINIEDGTYFDVHDNQWKSIANIPNSTSPASSS